MYAKAYVTVGSYALVVQDDLQPAHLLAAKDTMIRIVKKQDT